MSTSDALNWRFGKMTRRGGIGQWYAHEGRNTAVSIISRPAFRSGDQRHRGPQVHPRH